MGNRVTVIVLFSFIEYSVWDGYSVDNELECEKEMYYSTSVKYSRTEKSYTPEEQHDLR